MVSYPATFAFSAQFIIHFLEVMDMETTIILTEIHPIGKLGAGTIIQQVVSVWLVNELSKPSSHYE